MGPSADRGAVCRARLRIDRALVDAIVAVQFTGRLFGAS